MNCKIPFTKDILFEKKVSEITSISLEHEISTDNDMLKGNFIVSGDFKSHEVSVNKEAFSYILPFEIEITSDIDPDTIEFMIDDFTYEIIDNSILRVNIDFNVIASLKEISEVEEEPLFRDASELFLDEENTIIEKDPEAEAEKMADSVIEEEIDKEDTLKIEEIDEEKDDLKEEIRNQENIAFEMKEEIEKVSEDTIINSIKNVDDEYTTYHIHMVSDGETVETICTMYNSNLNILAEYNDLSELASGDKLIIPEKNE